MADATETPAAPEPFRVLGGYADVDDTTGHDRAYVVHLATPVGYYDLVLEARDKTLIVTPVEGGLEDDAAIDAVLTR